MALGIAAVAWSSVSAAEAQLRASRANHEAWRLAGEESLARLLPTICEYCKSPHRASCCPNCGGPVTVVARSPARKLDTPAPLPSPPQPPVSALEYLAQCPVEPTGWVNRCRC